MTETYDLAIVGGGIMGCSTALRLAEYGMKTIVLDQGDLILLEVLQQLTSGSTAEIHLD